MDSGSSGSSTGWGHFVVSYFNLASFHPKVKMGIDEQLENLTIPGIISGEKTHFDPSEDYSSPSQVCFNSSGTRESYIKVG